MDAQTDEQTKGWMDKPKAICPLNYFKVGALLPSMQKVNADNWNDSLDLDPNCKTVWWYSWTFWKKLI